MQAPSRDDLAKSGTLEELYGKLDQIGIAPGWAKRTPSLWPAPRKNFVPAHWRYEQARGALDAAGRLINTELAERRNLTLTNPAATSSGYGTLRTMVAAYQMIMPGEWARAHRHTPNALRLILDSDAGTYTEVDGVKISMEPGDVLLTPNWSSHGHGNDSRSCAYWLDFLDVPLVQLLEPMFFEPAEEDKTHEAFEKAPPTKDSPFVFPISETVKRLDAAAETGRLVRNECRTWQSGDGYDWAAHDAARPENQNCAIPHHREQHLRCSQRHRRNDGRRRTLRMAPWRRHRRSGVAAAFPRGCRGCAVAARHR
jgi:gentisate 1,2-dioxygenase